jgi:hypothetical protein
VTPEQLLARELAVEARGRLDRAQKDYDAAMRGAFAAGVSIGCLARALGMKYDAVRMYRKRKRLR